MMTTNLASHIVAMMTASLASCFGSWTAIPVVAYSQDMMTRYTAVIYIVSTYGERLPTRFTDAFNRSVPINFQT
jgi:hypothetical protein